MERRAKFHVHLEFAERFGHLPVAPASPKHAARAAAGPDHFDANRRHKVSELDAAQGLTQAPRVLWVRSYVFLTRG